MHKRRWAIAVAAVLVAVVAVTAAMAGTSRHATGKTYYYIPKDTLNPYEVIADHGGQLALTELGDTQVVSSGTADTAAAQQPAIQAAIRERAAKTPAGQWVLGFMYDDTKTAEGRPINKADLDAAARGERF